MKRVTSEAQAQPRLLFVQRPNGVMLLKVVTTCVCKQLLHNCQISQLLGRLPV